MLRITLFIIITFLYIIALIIFLKGPSQKTTASSAQYDGPLNLQRAVIHHTAGSKANDRDLSAAEIDVIHKKRTYVDKNGTTRHWEGIGYHFVIRRDGTVEQGRPLSKLGAHAKGWNDYIGIVLTGFDEFTEPQLNSLIILLTDLGVKKIQAHHSECPGPGLDVEHYQIVLDGFHAN